MELDKNLHLKLEKLMRVLWPSQTRFAQHCGAPLAVVNQFFTRKSDIRLKNLIQILDGLGIDLIKVIDDHAKKLFNERHEPDAESNSDFMKLLNSLEKNHKKEIILKTINLNKLKHKSKFNDVIQRVERNAIQ